MNPGGKPGAPGAVGVMNPGAAGVMNPGGEPGAGDA